MSDCSNNAWKLPKRADMEPGVLYMPSLDVDGVREIDAKGVRFERVRECEIVKWESTTNYGVVLGDCSVCGSPLDFDKYLDITKVNVRVNYCPNCGARVKEGCE